jgi:predicted N-acetyltransferase YhbS
MHGDGALEVSIRTMREADVPQADRIMRVAFGTFLGIPEPETIMGDRDFVKTRRRASPANAFVAEYDGRIVGSNLVARWGSVGFFGPLTVSPEFWNRGVAKRLMEPVAERFAAWKTACAGLFTFADSERHVGLYQRFGFWPRFLTALMTKPVTPRPPVAAATRFSAAGAGERAEVLTACREVADTIFEGLDLSAEIRAVQEQALGDTLLLWSGSRLIGFAVCHTGAGTEAGSGGFYLKFAAVRAGAGGDAFGTLLHACEAHAGTSGATDLTAGVNLGRHEAYRRLLAEGYRTQMQGVAMHKDNVAGYSVPGAFVIDDWR